VLVGGPGAGKTTLLTMSLVKAVSMGLTCTVTALMAERAQSLGGEHLNRVFCIPVNNQCNTSRLAELALIRMEKHPKRLEFLKTLDVLHFDEFGQLSAELLSVMDVIMRKIRKNGCFMGGVLLIASLDIAHLSPVRGRPPIMSPHMMVSFKFVKLLQPVRSGGDLQLQRIQEITRMTPSELSEPAIKDEFCHLIVTHCTHIHSWGDPRLKANMLRVFGKKEATQEAQRVFLEMCWSIMLKMNAAHWRGFGEMLQKRSLHCYPKR
jgi:hypothetical protein